MIRYAFIVLMLLLSGNLKAQSQRGGVNVGINTEKPTETLYLPEDYDKNWLDINGDLRVRDIPDFTKAQKDFLNPDGSDKPEMARRLYRDYISGSLETVENLVIQKPMYAIQYRINSITNSRSESQWRYLTIRDFNTAINAEKYTIFIVNWLVMDNPHYTSNNADGREHAGIYNSGLGYVALQNASGFQTFESLGAGNKEKDKWKPQITEFNPIDDVRMFVKDGTWHISADTYLAQPGELHPQTYVFTVIAVNNNYVNRIRVPGTDQTPITNIYTGYDSNKTQDRNPGVSVGRRGKSIYDDAPYGSLDRNPIDETTWIIPNNTERNDKHAYEY